jgi:excinuclease ABC subunit C
MIPVLYFLQRLRDESHRFVIGSHRSKRTQKIHKSILDDLPGVGAMRKKALLLHFGSAKAVEGAAIADLQKVNGISKALATQIYDYFHP